MKTTVRFVMSDDMWPEQPRTPNLFNSGIRPSIDAWLLEESKKVRSYGNYWSASSAGYCMRKNIFERLGVPHVSKDDDARKQRVFTSGHIFHDWIQGITKAAGISIAQEVELQDEDLMIRGHFDDLVLVPEKPEYLMDIIDPSDPEKALSPKQNLILYDYKTVNSRSFLWAKKNDNAMSHYHRYQLGTYMYMLRKMKISAPMPKTYPTEFGTQTRPEVQRFDMQDLAEARILKLEKDTLMMGEQQLLWSLELESEVLNYWKTLNAHWNNKTLPACSCANQEGGFMAKEKFNPFWYAGEPCSLELYKQWKAAQ